MRQGQAVLIILLVVAVSLGLAISIIAQSTTDVKISQHEQESVRAFNAAEAGIEQALKNISTITIGEPQSLPVDGIEVNYEVSGQKTLEASVAENESAQVVLGGMNNTVKIEWIDKTKVAENPGLDDCSGVQAKSGLTPASLLITVVDKNYQVRRFGINACNLTGDNNMPVVNTLGDNNYFRQYSFPVTTDDELVRIRPLYNQASLRVTGASELPIQTYLINSSAQAETLESKAIEVSRTEPATPSIFDYVLFSGSSIIK